jgi:hypothetical protein
MRNIFKVSLYLIAAGLVINSCTRHRSPRMPGDIADRRTVAEYSNDLMGLPGDDSVITADVPAADDTVREESDQVTFPDNEIEDQAATTAFSVQLFASKSNEEAENFKLEVEPMFDEIVSIDYKAPYYKVRVGETPTLEEGEALLDNVKRMGFKNAWLVRIRH